MSMHTYLPQDRLRALTTNTTLPDRTSGTALFADISGFTALTERLRESLGTRQGAEELTRQLGAIYSALIVEVEKYGGSVIGFAGDAMMCWFDAWGDRMQKSAVRAVRAAFGMQEAIKESPALALKVSIASGSGRRFVVGDQDIQWLDTLAGATVARTAMGEHLATKGDILVDDATVSYLGDALSINEWRVNESGERFAVVEKLSANSEQISVQSLIADASVLRPFIHRAVYERETSGQGSFLTEFRPCVALFMRFTGIEKGWNSENPKQVRTLCMPS